MNDLYHFEDFTIGRTFAFGAYTVTKDEIFEFARAFDPQPHHLDEEAANAYMLKGLSASGWHVCAMTMRMFAEGIILKTANRGGVGCDEARWVKPVRPGDLLRLEVVVRAAKESPRHPGVGFVTFDCNVFNQREQVAMVSMTPIILKRGA